MWLPKAERTLLTLYYLAQDGSPAPLAPKVYRMASLCEAFCSRRLKKAAQRSLRDGEGDTVRTDVKQYKKFLATKSQIDGANQLLVKRGLITLAGQDLYPEVALTQAGYDLGRKYSQWFLWLGLWWSEYKGHCLVGGFLAAAGLAVGRLVKLLWP